MSLMRLFSRFQVPRSQSSEGFLGAGGFTQGGLSTWLASWSWLLAGDFSSSPREPLHRAVWVFSQDGFPRARDQREIRQSYKVFYDLALELINSLLSTIPYWFYRSVLFSVGGDYTVTWIPGAKKHCGHLKGWLPYWLNLVSVPPTTCPPPPPPILNHGALFLVFQTLSHCIIAYSFNYFSLSLHKTVSSMRAEPVSVWFSIVLSVTQQGRW